MLKPKEAEEQVRRMLRWREKEAERLERIHLYLRNRQQIITVPTGVPEEVRRLAKVAKVNVLGLVVDNVSQSMYVDGYRLARAANDAPAWDVWQRNRMDARQIGIHRAFLAYGVSYATVLPGVPVPVIRGHSPRRMSVLYGEDDNWPMWALQGPEGGMFRLYDDEAVYFVGLELAKPSEPWGPFKGANQALTFIESREHGLGVNPVVRYRNVEDLDDEVIGEVEPLIALQDQINITTFGLLVAQHYGAFRQRYILGWLAETEAQKLKASASRLWTFEDGSDQMKVGEFSQTDLEGYLASREASLRHLATVSQTPAHELLGQLVNLSAEALAAAEASQRRKIAERETTAGESHEQVLELSSSIAGYEVDPGAQVRWRDTEARSLAQTVDALGKMAQMLGIPPQALWEKVPGVSQQDVEGWKTQAAEGDAITNLTAMLERQAGGDAA